MRSTRFIALVALFLVVQAAMMVTAARYRIKNRYLNGYAKAVPGANPKEMPIVADNNPEVGRGYTWDIVQLEHGRGKRRYYEIKHTHSKFAASGNAAKGSGSRVVAVPEDKMSAWQLSPRFNDHNPTHSFVIYLGDEDLVWTLENGVVRLRPFENKPTQQWAIVQEGRPLYEWLHQQ